MGFGGRFKVEENIAVIAALLAGMAQVGCGMFLMMESYLEAIPFSCYAAFAFLAFLFLRRHTTGAAITVVFYAGGEIFLCLFIYLMARCTRDKEYDRDDLRCRCQVDVGDYLSSSNTYSDLIYLCKDQNKRRMYGIIAASAVNLVGTLIVARYWHYTRSIQKSSTAKNSTQNSVCPTCKGGAVVESQGQQSGTSAYPSSLVWRPAVATTVTPSAPTQTNSSATGQLPYPSSTQKY